MKRHHWSGVDRKKLVRSDLEYKLLSYGRSSDQAEGTNIAILLYLFVWCFICFRYNWVTQAQTGPQPKRWKFPRGMQFGVTIVRIARVYATQGLLHCTKMQHYC